MPSPVLEPRVGMDRFEDHAQLFQHMLGGAVVRMAAARELRKAQGLKAKGQQAAPDLRGIAPAPKGRQQKIAQIRVLGLATIAPDVTPDLARATIASVAVLGTLHASPAVKAALADRMR